MTAVPVPSQTPADAASAAAWLPPARRAGSGTPAVCFPPAGAGAGFFRDWGTHLPSARLIPVQLPGREERFNDRPMTDAVAIAGAVAEAIEAEAWDSVVLLGYSFGALLAFETALALEAGSRCAVTSVIACARAAPQTEALETVADWPDDAFLTYVRDLGGLPPEVEAVPEFVDLLLPILRADFRANDGYSGVSARRIAAPITTIAGSSDPATADGRDRAWAERTSGGHTLRLIDGGHFFIIDNREAAFGAIAEAMTRDSSARGRT